MLEAVGRAVIVKLKHDEKAGRIFIPEGAKAQGAEFHGEVILVGEDMQFEIEVGDKIIFQRNEGFEFEYEGEKYKTVRQMHIYGVWV